MIFNKMYVNNDSKIIDCLIGNVLQKLLDVFDPCNTAIISNPNEEFATLAVC